MRRLNSTDPRTSAMGLHSVTAVSAARANASSEGAWPSSAASACRARAGVGATAPSATRARSMRSPAIVSAAATPTTAMSICLRGVCLSYALPLLAGGTGTRTSASSSSAANAVVPGPRKNSSSASVRRPDGPTITASASYARSGGAISAEGAALQTLPPTVAMFIVWIDPTSEAPSATA